MTADELRALQAPLKERYKSDPAAARATLRAIGLLEIDRIACRIESHQGGMVMGLHPATGGDGSHACSAEMLLEALAGCAGTTLCAVATAMGLPVTGGTVTAEGDLDFRGTLGVDRETPVGFTALRLKFDLQSTATPEQIAKLVQLTERYCVVLRTLQTPPGIEATTV